MRQPAAIVTLLAALSIILLSPSLGIFDLGEERKIAVDTSLAAALLAGLFTVLFAASQTVSAELQSRTALTLLAKPVSWETFLVGKFLGVAGAGLTAIALLVMPVLVMARLSGDNTADYSVTLRSASVQDAEVSSREPEAALGHGEALRVFKAADGTDERIVYLLFDLEMPHLGTVHSVILHLRWLGPDEVPDATATDAKNVQVYTVRDTVWSEHTLTWNSRPPLDRRIAILPSHGASREYEIPLRRYAVNRRMLAVAIKARGPVNAYFGGMKAKPGCGSKLELSYYAIADPTAPYVLIAAGVVWLGLGLLLARGRARSPYAAAAWSYAIACLFALVLLSAMVGWEKFRIDLGLFQVPIPGVRIGGPLALLGFRVAGWDWPVLHAVCLHGMEIVVLAAVGVAVAARAGRVATFIGILAVFSGGHMAGDWATRFASGAPEGWKAVVVSVLPNLEHFNLGDRIASGEILPASLLGLALLYMTLYALAALLVGMALIRGREVK